MNADVINAALWLETEYKAGRLSDEEFYTYIKGCMIIHMEREIVSRIEKWNDKLSLLLKK